MSAAYGLSFMVLTTIKQEEEKSKQEEEKSKKLYQHNTKEIEMVPLSFSFPKQCTNSCFEPILLNYCNV